MALIGHWKLDGDATDSSGNGYDGNAAGSTISGKLGNAIDFTSSSGSTIGTASSLPDMTADLTLSFWIYINAWPASRMGIMQTVYGGEFALNIDTAGQIQWYYGTSSIQAGPYTAWTTPSGTLELQNWIHITLVRDTENMQLRVYKNGEYLDFDNLSTSYVPTAQASDSYPLKLGISYTGALKGALDDVRIYNHVLSQKEIKELSKAKVLHYKFDVENDFSDSSGQDNHATNGGAAWTSTGKLGEGAYEMTNLTQITTNYGAGLNPSISPLTITAWVYPTTTSHIVFSFGGTTGSNQRVYVGINVGTWSMGVQSSFWGTGAVSAEYNKWCFVSLTMDGSTAILRINNTASETKGYTSFLVPGTFGINNYSSFSKACLIDDVRIYKTALSTEGIQELYQTRASLDNSGVLYTHHINETKHKPLLMDYTVWEDGQTGSVASFNDWSEGNSRVIATDPFGKQTVVWKISTQDPPDATYPSQGGIYHDSQTIDNTKMYRVSWWENRVTNNGATYGRYYAGCNGYPDPVLNRSSGSPNSNPYFEYIDHDQFPTNEWVLIVGHVWPVGSGIGAEHPDSGVYNVDGSLRHPINLDFIFDIGTTSFRTRTLAIYQGNVSGMIHHTAYPRLDVVDGTEPSIADLLSGHDSRNIDYVRDKGGTSNISLDITDQKTNLGTLSEIGPTNGLAAWYPLSGDVKDYAASNDGTLSGATPTERGYLFDTTTESIEVTNPLSAGEPHTVSMWIKPSTILPDTTSSGSRKTPFTGDGLVWSPGIWLTRRVIRVHAATEYRDYTIDYNTTDWWHIGQIFDGTTCYTIINGEIVLGTRTGYSPTNPTTFRIGNEASSSSNSWDGIISDVRIYNRALQSEEISILYSITDPTNSTKMKQTSDTLFLKGEFKETY